MGQLYLFDNYIYVVVMIGFRNSYRTGLGKVTKYKLQAILRNLFSSMTMFVSVLSFTENLIYVRLG